MFVPKGMVVSFYCAHGAFGTKGVGIAEYKMGAEVALPQVVLSDLMQRKTTENWAVERLDQEILLAKANANAQGLGSDMQIVDSVAGKGFGNRQKVYDYTLSHAGPNPTDRRAEDLWNTHSKAGANIDLIIMKAGAVGHLSSAVSFARAKGEKYQVFHYLPCRHVDSNDAKSSRTVTANLSFGKGVDFIETSVL